jgi:threonyl-tRNA synthetase
VAAVADLAIAVVTAEGEESRSVPEGATAADVVGDGRRVVVARINGELRDLATILRDGDVVEAVGVDTPEGLAVLRHSTAHVLAQAVQDTFADAKLGIGPPVKDGFYYDFSVETPFTPEDLKVLEKRMQEIVKSGQRFSRRVVTDAEAKHELAGEPFKLRLIGSEGGADVMEVGGAELTIYDNVEAKSGATCWGDLCRGPHVPDTRFIPPNAFEGGDAGLPHVPGGSREARPPQARS